MDLITSLNYDCLDKIFKMLNLSDRLNLALSCQSLYDICTRRLNLDFKSNLTTQFFNTLRALQIKVLLSILGPYTKKLIVELPFEEKSYDRESVYFKLLEFFCNNVETLQYNGWSVDDESTKWLISLRNLKSLAIVNNLDTTGKYIYNLNNLQELSLNNCCRIEPQHFQQIFRNLKNLKYLDIRNCSQLKSQHYQEIAKNLTQLQTLKLSTTYENINYLTQLPKLTHLEIWRNNILSSPITQEFLYYLAQYQGNQLQKLKLVDCASLDADKTLLVSKLNKLKGLHCICNPFNDEMLEKFSDLKDLEELYISDCHFVTNNSVYKILQNCQNLKRLDLGSCNVLTADITYKI